LLPRQKRIGEAYQIAFLLHCKPQTNLGPVNNFNLPPGCTISDLDEQTEDREQIKIEKADMKLDDEKFERTTNERND
jgi:hypothetical protein